MKCCWLVKILLRFSCTSQKCVVKYVCFGYRDWIEYIILKSKTPKTDDVQYIGAHNCAWYSNSCQATQSYGKTCLITNVCQTMITSSVYDYRSMRKGLYVLLKKFTESIMILFSEQWQLHELVCWCSFYNT